MSKHVTIWNKYGDPGHPSARLDDDSGFWAFLASKLGCYDLQPTKEAADFLERLLPHTPYQTLFLQTKTRRRPMEGRPLKRSDDE